MTADLVAYTADPSGLDQLDRHAVTELLERGKTWLRLALDRDSEIGDLVNYKGEAQVLRELVTQKELGRDAELAATELVRRAEAGIAHAIRRGQEAGEIRKRGDDSRTDLAGHNHLVSPTSFLPKDELYGNGAGIMHLADVTPDRLDAAIDEAKAEGNLSRANVVRKATGRPKPDPASLAIPQPPKFGGNRRKHLQVLQAVTANLAGIAHAADEIADLDGSVTQEEAAQLVRDLSRQIQSLNRIRNLLKERNR